MIKKIFTLFLSSLIIFSFNCCKKETRKKEELDAIAFEVDEKIANMTIDEKIAQMIILEINNDGILPSPSPAGVILFDENFTTCEETRALIDTLNAQSEIPLIISTDQEGGRVQRLSSIKKPKATSIPSMYELGKTGDTALAKEVGGVMAKEMRALGINLTFAPCLDVYSNPNNTVIGNRSFGEDASAVSSMALSLAEGLKENGVMPCYKHFPGHGDTDIDSHYTLPIINKTKDQLYKTELIPFENAIENGAEIIMVGHIALPSLTGDNTPATLSKEIVTDLLKAEMGFEGIVITDSFKMKALTDNYSQEEMYKRAVEAGVDIILMPKNFHLALKVIKENFSEERINESVRKILYYKQKNLTGLIEYDISVIGASAHNEIIKRIS